MGTITSGVGLVSGIDTAGLIDQLMEIEAVPRQRVERQKATLASQKTAFQDVNAQLLSLESAISTFVSASGSVFGNKAASSTQPSVIAASANQSATPGTYTLTPDRLVTTQQMISKGLTDTDTSTFGERTLSFESARARLDREVNLSSLNAGAGVQRGTIRITDAGGAVESIDLTRAVTLDDVIQTINQSTDVAVTASIDGDRLKLTDNSGGGGDLTVVDLGGRTTAADLGIAGSSGTGELAGSQINRIATTTSLSRLNDGLGIRRVTAQADLTINDRAGTSFDVNLDDAQTLDDVLGAINDAASGAGANVTAALGDDQLSIKLTDSTGSPSQALTVAAANGSMAAADLGLTVTDFDDDGVIAGDRLLASMGSVLLKNLGGGSGVDMGFALAPQQLTPDTLLSDLFQGAGLTTTGDGLTDIKIRARDNSFAEYQFDIDALSTVQDLIDAVDSETGGRVELVIEDQALRANDLTGGTNYFRINPRDGSVLAVDELGLRINAHEDTVLGVDTDPARLEVQDQAHFGPGQIQITSRDGNTTEVDLSGARSVSDVVNLINEAGAGVTAALNDAGNGIQLTDTTGAAASNLIVQDVGGNIAGVLGIATDPAGVDDAGINGGDLDLQYINENTQLDSLNNGQGVAEGSFTIRNSEGINAVVDLTGGEATIGEVISEINSRGIGVTAAINDTGDGIVLTDANGGAVRLKVTENGSTTAADLGLLGEDEDEDGRIDGSLEKTVSIAADDTLDDVAQAINDADVGVTATIVNDGSTDNPYRLNLISDTTGTKGRFVFDDGGLELGTSTLVEAQDAVAFFGSSDPTQSLLVTSSSNTLTETIPGVTLDLLGTSTSPVEITVNRDTEAIKSAVDQLVSTFNGVMDKIESLDKFDAETSEKGVLLGDPTLQQIQRQLFDVVTRQYDDVSGQFQHMSQVGVSIGEGARLQFDESKFLQALEADPEGVTDLFSLEKKASAEDTELGEGITIPGSGVTVTARGFGATFEELLDRFTDSIDGTLARTTNGIDDRIELADNRIESINQLLAVKRQRLETEFNAMETALAQLQSQQSALSSLASLASQAQQSTGFSFG